MQGNGTSSGIDFGKTLLAGAATFDFRIKFETSSDITTQQQLAGERYTNNAQFYISGGSLYYRFTIGGVSELHIQAGLAINTTYEARVTYDGSNMKSYLDGVLVDTEVASGTVDVTDGHFALMCAVRASDGNKTKFFNGVMYDVLLIVDGTTVLHTPLNEGAGQTVADISGNNNTGTGTDLAWTTYDRVTTNSNEDGRIVESNCGSFNGTNSNITVTNSSSFAYGAGDITFAFNVSLDDLTSFHGLYNAVSGNRYLIIASNVSGRVSIDMRDDDLDTYGKRWFINTLNVNQVYSFIFVIDKSDTINFYIDNVLQTPDVEVGTLSNIGDLTTTDNKTIGKQSGRYLKGCLTGFGLWHKTLNATERVDVTQVSDPKVFLAISEGSGSTIHDISGNSNHGTGTNLTWSTQDEYHYNLLNGYRLSGAVKIPILADGSAAADGNAITNPSGFWHNGAESKICIGALEHDGTGYPCIQSVKDNDPSEIFHSASTGYCIPKSYDDIEAVFDTLGGIPTYAFCNTQTAYQYKDLLIYIQGSEPTLGNSVKLAKFIEIDDYLVVNDSGQQTFDDNDQAIVAI